MRRMGRYKRITYLLKHSAYLNANAGTFAGIPNDGEAVRVNALELQEQLIAQRRGKKLDIAYKDQLDVCFDMMDANYDFVDYVSGGDVDINSLSGLNSRKNTKPRTKRPKTDTAARWIPDITPNQLTLETTRDEVSRITTVISSTDEGFKVEVTQQNRIKISLGDKSCLIDFSTAAKILLKYLEGGKPIEAFIVKANANGVSIPRKLPKNVPNVDGNYRPAISPVLPPETSAEDPE